jgi:hypothetical protein
MRFQSYERDASWRRKLMLSDIAILTAPHETD